ncbi:MAG TPA: glycosyltransferase family 4 protein [Allosphingosinicella sp.]|nr:glycosyltransferase family 4 protein [Allosphingosinicella sp.]
MAPVRILHCHSTFSLGGKEARAVRLMNAFGDAAEHHVVSAMPDRLAARDAIAKGIAVVFPTDAPPLAGAPTPIRLWKLALYMKRFELVLTYNWGAFDMVMARRLFGRTMKLPPLIHHEDGFNEDEAERLNKKRNRYRKLGLKAAHALVVPSERLERIARRYWGRAPLRIPNGVPVAAYAKPPEPGAIPGFERQGDEIVIGTVAGLRAVKNLPRLVRAFAGMTHRNARLVIVGEGPESERIAAEARTKGVAARVLMPGFLAEPARWIGHFDIFALSSDSEQFPISLVEAMAAGLPAVATAVGDVPGIVAEDNKPLIVEIEDDESLAQTDSSFAAALDSLADRPDLRRAIGEANRDLARERYDEKEMIAAYARLYGEAIGLPRAFTGAG